LLLISLGELQLLQKNRIIPSEFSTNHVETITQY